jgi:hypothetical protein
MRVATCIAATVLALLIAGCGPPRPDNPTAVEASARNACGDGANAPLVVDWQPERRMDLESAMGERLAVVQWQCPELRVLPGCHVEGGYRYVGTSPKEQMIRMRDGASIAANLPLSAASLTADLEASFAQGASLDLALVMVGKRATDRARFSRDELRGSCAGATHVVHSATLGAFAMGTGASAESRTVAEVFDLGASFATSSSRSVQTRDGELSACAAAGTASTAAPAQCDAVLRVELAPVGEPAPPVAVLSPQQVEGLAGKFCSDPAACRQRCESGDSRGCFEWGVILMLGDRVDRDLGAGTRAMVRSCELGEMTACTLVGIAYLGAGHERADAEKGRRMLSGPCDRGQAQACMALGQSYENAGDAQTAARFFQRACSLGERSGCR